MLTGLNPDSEFLANDFEDFIGHTYFAGYVVGKNNKTHDIRIERMARTNCLQSYTYISQ